jgi:crotonobetainyl-CoA:carnitine CoA-transferase CaiB-like acyl-CoA transferase
MHLQGSARAQGVVKDGLSRYFAIHNRSKRSVTLDLRSPEGMIVR